MPIEMHRKYIVNSKGDLTGFLNLTIERAPTKPRDSAKLFDITDVTENVMIGRRRNDIEWANVLHHSWPLKTKTILKKTANKTIIKILNSVISEGDDRDRVFVSNSMRSL